ncbi:MAG TPA: hypothetical protein PLN92_07315 [Thermotogota bacterium]|nr:hypothetical protein [Thermotogota bacterium]
MGSRRRKESYITKALSTKRTILSKSKILFRTNGGQQTGLGHIMRCLSLAKAIKQTQKATIIFRINQDIEPLVKAEGFQTQITEAYNQQDATQIINQNPDYVVFDSYLATSLYLETIQREIPIIQFDDNNDIYTPVVANIIINGNIHAESLNYQSKNKNTRFLLGPKYLIMRDTYWQDTEITKGKGILITTGGSDFLHLMSKFIQTLQNTTFLKKIIIGPAYEESEIEEIRKLTHHNQTFQLIHKPTSLKKHIASSEMVITAAGSTVYEVLRLRKIPLIYTLADNQKQIDKTLTQNGVVSLGNHQQLQFDEIHLLKRMHEATITKKKLENLFDIIDGKGVFRILEKITQKNECTPHR